jgi:hypothetical protein
VAELRAAREGLGDDVDALLHAGDTWTDRRLAPVRRRFVRALRGGPRARGWPCGGRTRHGRTSRSVGIRHQEAPTSSLWPGNRGAARSAAAHPGHGASDGALPGAWRGEASISSVGSSSAGGGSRR